MAGSSADKWGIPFFYSTAPNAGVSGEGSGAFWQQNNDIFTDSKNGIVRLGKEYDDVNVISESTGEWEFPYDSGADYYALDINMGHASGGETHGCEAAHYIVNVTINDTPPKFYFQKQMYHGGTKYEHKTGKFTHPKVTEKVVGNGWKGFCGVRYNVKNGRSTGKDSVVLEIWWNEDPTGSNLKDGWIKVAKVEDKGGWGKGGDTCGGDSDQVITWSGVQWRYKSGTPEWSVHPILREYEDGENIHCTDEEKMCFSVAEKRGYCKDERIPRDTEQKILFKFEANDGIARLKNASLREIDPTKALDETPDQPDQNEEPEETKTIQGKFKLQWDLNIARVSACAGAGAGGYGGSSVFYSIELFDDERQLGNHVDFDYRTRAAETNAGTGCIINGKVIKQFDIPLKRVGAAPTGNVVAKIWNQAGSVVYTSSTTVTAAGLSTSFATINYDFSTNTHAMVVGDRIGVQYAGTSNSEYVRVQIREADIVGSGNRASYYENLGTWSEITSDELTCIMWE